MKLIFLDIDGVLNAHEKLPSGYCGIARPCVDQLNRILAAVPDAQLVISSAWRYLVLRENMTVKGFEYLLLVHGVQCHERVHGITDADGAIADEPNHFDTDAWKVAGLKWRCEQIQNYLQRQPCWGREDYLVLDDLALSVPNLVKTDGEVGLTAADADRAIALLSSAPPAPSPGEAKST